MKLMITLVTVSALSSMISIAASATPAPVACGTHEKNIADAYAELLKTGEASGDEVKHYQILSLKAQVVCGTLTSAQACDSESKIANQTIDSVQAQVTAGFAPPVFYDKAVVDMTALIAPCSL